MGQGPAPDYSDDFHVYNVQQSKYLAQMHKRRKKCTNLSMWVYCTPRMHLHKLLIRYWLYIVCML
jgi:hypothetical protein